MKTKVQDGDLEEEEHGQAIEKAFTHSETATLGKLRLQPYTPDRVVAAQAMGRHFGYLDDAAFEQFKKTAVYPGMLADVVKHIWLRSLSKNSDFEIDQAIRDPVAATKKAIAFGAKLGIIDTASEQFKQAWDVFIGDMEAVRHSRMQPAEKKTRNKTAAK